MLRKLLPEWREMGTPRRAIEALWTPAAGGIGAGFGATISTGAWVLNVVLAIIGAVTFGAQHRSQQVSVVRGAFSGALFAACVVAGYHLFGHSTDAPAWLLPPNDALLFLMLFTASLPLHQLGTWLRVRLSPQPAREPVTVAGPVSEPAAAGFRAG